MEKVDTCNYMAGYDRSYYDNMNDYNCNISRLDNVSISMMFGEIAFKAFDLEWCLFMSKLLMQT